ncbi:MAG: SDR family oxidoreductase [Steroidobacteraceae bacterium]|jgi:NAD(P)-dependent dehydrogenase (short-subunit alcohol dehydrogenase family)|nr:SDR family oxidoreductase [Steroidobacteraceae bacterium]
MSLFDLQGRTAIVTGSSRGIGRAIAERLAEHGARVVISSRKPEPCHEVAGEINARHGAGRALAVPANISSRSDLASLVQRTRDAFGPVSTLVCNAASNPHYGPMSSIPDDAFRKILENNILSNHWLVQLVVPDMRALGEGSITVISSIAGLKGQTTIGAYGISKAADLQLVRNLAVELGPLGIRANSIAPGIVRTDFARALWEDPVLRAQMENSSPLRRFGEPDDIAGAAVFLASPAGRYVTGQTLVIDGGGTIA